MKKLNTFLYVFKNSSLKPGYYQDVLKAPFKFSLKYFLALFLVISLLTALAASIFVNQSFKPYLKRMETDLPSFYPNELTITIKNGQVSTNVEEPFFIPLKPELFPEEINQALKSQPISNILVINTQAQPQDIKKYQTFALLTKNTITFFADRNEIRIYGLTEVKDFVINQSLITRIWQKILPYFRWLIPILILSLFLIVPSATLIIRFAYLVFFSLITLLIAKIFKFRQIRYTKALQINLHAITLPTIITSLFQFLGAPPQVPLFSTVILLIFNLIILTSIKPQK